MATNFYTELNLNNNNLTGLPSTPSGATAAASKAYVDARANGKDPKNSAKYRIATNIALTKAAAETAIGGGVTLSDDDRLLLTGQSIGSENRIYIVSGSTLTISSDSNLSEAELKGASLFIEEGASKGKGYVFISNADGWTQHSDTGSLGAGNGLQINGTNFEVKAGSNITVDANGVSVSGQIPVANGGTGAATFTAGFLKANGTSAFTTVAGIGITEVSGRRLIGNYTAPQGSNTQTISTASFDSTLRGSAAVTVFDSANNQVFADVQVNSDNVKIITTHNTVGGIALKYLITV